jgi:hypothetical protein
MCLFDNMTIILLQQIFLLSLYITAHVSITFILV